jgi:hypothetical protein
LNEEEVLARHRAIAIQFDFGRPSEVKTAWGDLHHPPQPFVPFKRLTVDDVLPIGNKE